MRAGTRKTTTRKTTTTRAKAGRAKPTAQRKSSGFRIWYGSSVLRGVEGENGRKGLSFGDSRTPKRSPSALVVLGRENRKRLRDALTNGTLAALSSAGDRKVMVVTQVADEKGRMRLERQETVQATGGTSRKITNRMTIGPKQRAALCAFLAA